MMMAQRYELFFRFQHFSHIFSIVTFIIITYFCFQSVVFGLAVRKVRTRSPTGRTKNDHVIS